MVVLAVCSVITWFTYDDYDDKYNNSKDAGNTTDIQSVLLLKLHKIDVQLFKYFCSKQSLAYLFMESLLLLSCSCSKLPFFIVLVLSNGLRRFFIDYIIHQYCIFMRFIFIYFLDTKCIALAVVTHCEGGLLFWTFHSHFLLYHSCHCWWGTDGAHFNFRNHGNCTNLYVSYFSPLLSSLLKFSV